MSRKLSEEKGMFGVVQEIVKMQTYSQIRKIMRKFSLSPKKRLGQCFLIDLNLMEKILSLAEISSNSTVLEVGPATGSLTEEILSRAERVVAVEIDRGLVNVLRKRFDGEDSFDLIAGDVLAGKNEISPLVLEKLPPRTELVSNLPYNIATPLVVLCMLKSLQAQRGCGDGTFHRFDRMTFTVQLEVADRLTAEAGRKEYGRASVLTALLTNTTIGPIIPASAFRPQPKVQSRILRMDFDEDQAKKLKDPDNLLKVLSVCFSHRRKQISSILRNCLPPDARTKKEDIPDIIHELGIEPSDRPQNITPHQFRELSEILKI